MNKMKGKKDCKICSGNGEMNVQDGADDFRIDICYCTIAYKQDEKLQDIALDSVK